MEGIIFMFDADVYGKIEVTSLSHEECILRSSDHREFNSPKELQDILNEDKSKLTYNWIVVSGRESQK